MSKGRANRSGVNWSDPAAVREYKRNSERHHEYNRQYSRLYYQRKENPQVGGQGPGELHPRHKLTWPIVRWMRAAYARGDTSYTRLQRTIRERFDIDIHVNTIAGIIRGENWKEEDDPDA